jgi:hypothetical protein
MTDREDNGRDQTPASFGLPTAGRKPPAADVPEEERDDPAADRPRLDLPDPSGEDSLQRSGEDSPQPSGDGLPERSAEGGDGDEDPDGHEGRDEGGNADVEDTRTGEPAAGETSATSPVPSSSDTPGAVAAESDLGRKLVLKRPAPAGTLIWVLLALLGFTLVVQLRSNDVDSGLSTARQEDLVRILSDLEARDSRLQSEISALETSQRQLTSGVVGRPAALEEAEKRADELGLLAGTVAGRGPGLRIEIDGVKA